MRQINGFMWPLLALALIGCGTDSESSRDAGTDTAEVSPVFCSSNVLGACGEGEHCVFDGSGGNCTDWLGVCEPIPAQCADDWGDWRASSCGQVSYPSRCAARAQGRGGPLLLASTTTVGAACDPSANPSECDEDQACAFVGAESGGPSGRCVSLTEVCSDAPVVPVCQTSSVTGSAYGECWDSPCVAWRSGYRGLLSVDR